MVQTRSQGKESRNGESTEHSTKTFSTPTSPAATRRNNHNTSGQTRPSKETKDLPRSEDRLKSKLDEILAKYGDAPLQGLIADNWTSSKVVMAHILNALLSSTRISHNIAMATLKCVLSANYHDLDALHRSTWQRRTEVLTEGGYVHYREKTATYLGDLADLMKQKYHDDASNILPTDEKGGKARDMLSARLQEVKGLGPTGIGIFLGSIQNFFPNIAPFLDVRSRKTAKTLGLCDELDEVFLALNQSASAMAKLEVALTTVRLEKRENEFS